MQKAFWIIGGLWWMISLFSGHALAATNSTPPPKRDTVKNTGEAIHFVQKRLVHVQLGFWGPRIKQGKKHYTLNLGNLGRMRNIFFEDRLATRYFDRYQGFFISGFVLTILGTVSLTSAAVWMIVEPSVVSRPAQLPVFMTLFLAGTALGITGPLLLAAGNSLLMRAIKTFNQGVFSRARKGKWRVSFSFRPEGGLSACVSGQF